MYRFWQKIRASAWVGCWWWIWIHRLQCNDSLNNVG